MFQNTLTPPPLKVPQLAFLFKPNATMNYHDATMNIIIWIHDFPSYNPF